ADKILQNIKKQAAGRNRICILMHDAAAKVSTADALPAVIEYLLSEGFELKGLDINSFGFHHQSLNN
ncbi:MAG: hypothetical protein RR177_04650, partial [Oscillospiraceae bacterium]